MQKRNLVLIISVVIAVLVVTSGVVLAKPDKNPNFPTHEEVEQMISSVNQNFQGQIDGLQNQINGFNSQIAALDTKINGLETYFQGKINELNQRIALLEAAVTSNTQEIAGINIRLDELEDKIPTPKPEPKSNLELFTNDPEIAGNYVKISARMTSPEQKKTTPWGGTPPWYGWSIDNAQFWGVLHTPNGDINSQILYVDYFERAYCNLIFEMPQTYPAGSLSADIFASYGGKVVSKTVSF